MDKSVTVRAPGKINLFLDIVGQAANGYHFLKTVMQTVSLYDEITIKKEEPAGIRIYCDDEGVPSDETNLAYKAAEAFFHYLESKNNIGLKGTGLGISLEKNIPSRAGLAGGSADAAGVLLGLNALFEAGLSESELSEIAAGIGADVPFCLKGGTALAEGIGEIITPLPYVSDDCAVLIAKPKAGCSTPAVFKAYDRIEAPSHLDCDELIAAIASGEAENFAPLCGNVLEQAVSLPEIKIIRDAMSRSGALGSSMSGSGSAVFGIFKKKKQALSCIASLPEGYFTSLCRTVSTGPEII